MTDTDTNMLLSVQMRGCASAGPGRLLPNQRHHQYSAPGAPCQPAHKLLSSFQRYFVQELHIYSVQRLESVQYSKFSLILTVEVETKATTKRILSSLNDLRSSRW